MGVLYGYYTAADDEDARRAIVREDGEPSGTGYDDHVVKGLDPVVVLRPAEAAITGRSEDEVEADPRQGQLIAMVGDGEVVSVSLTDALRDALAGWDRKSMGDVARAWAMSEEFSTPPDPSDLAGFLGELAALARRAVARGHRMYCWICP